MASINTIKCVKNLTVKQTKKAESKINIYPGKWKNYAKMPPKRHLILFVTKLRKKNLFICRLKNLF